jgi:hypothetical protein
MKISVCWLKRRRLDEGSHSAPDVTDSEMFMFLDIIVQMKHDNREQIKEIGRASCRERV